MLQAVQYEFSLIAQCELIPESLKNLLLVMETAQVFSSSQQYHWVPTGVSQHVPPSPDSTPDSSSSQLQPAQSGTTTNGSTLNGEQLWALSVERVRAFLPELYADLMQMRAPQPSPAAAASVSPSPLPESNASAADAAAVAPTDATQFAAAPAHPVCLFIIRSPSSRSYSCSICFISPICYFCFCCAQWLCQLVLICTAIPLQQTAKEGENVSLQSYQQQQANSQAIHPAAAYSYYSMAQFHSYPGGVAPAGAPVCVSEQPLTSASSLLSQYSNPNVCGLCNLCIFKYFIN